MLLLGARGKLTCLRLVFQEAGAAEQHGCDRPGAAAVPPPHRPADHEGECAGKRSKPRCQFWKLKLVRSGTSNAAAVRIWAVPEGAAVGGFWSSACSVFRHHQRQRGPILRCRSCYAITSGDAKQGGEYQCCYPSNNPPWVPRRAAACQHKADGASPAGRHCWRGPTHRSLLPGTARPLPFAVVEAAGCRTQRFPSALPVPGCLCRALPLLQFSQTQLEKVTSNLVRPGSWSCLS